MRSKRARRPIRDDFDGAWKNMLSEQRLSDFIAFFIPGAFADIGWSRGVEFLEQELRAITRKTKRGQKTVDRLAKVWLFDGTEKWVLIHIEIQSQQEEEFGERMFRYYFRARDLFPGRSIACLAVLGDSNTQWRPQGFSDGLWDTSVSFRFRSVKLLDYANRLSELETSANPFARFTLAHLKTLETQGDYENRLAWKLRIIKGLYDMGVSEAEVGQLYHDFDWLLALPEPLENRYHIDMTRFEEEKSMPHLTTAERIGRREGRKEGRVEELRELVIELMQERFETIPADLADRIAQTEDRHRLRRVIRLLFDNVTLQDIEQELSRT